MTTAEHKLTDEQMEKSLGMSVAQAKKASETALRDELAKDRTYLANERTLLAYANTSLGLVGASIIMYKLLPVREGVPLAAITIVIAFIVAIYGYGSFKRVQAKIKEGGGIHE
jgi:putative membrane protein